MTYIKRLLRKSRDLVYVWGSSLTGRMLVAFYAKLWYDERKVIPGVPAGWGKHRHLLLSATMSGLAAVLLFCRVLRLEIRTITNRKLRRDEYTMNLKRVHHIAIIGSNYQQSKHFYVDLLGFSIVRENYRPERDDYKIDLQLDGMELELFIIKNCPKRPSYPEAYGLRHLAFAVDSVDDTVRELNKRGITTEPIKFDTYTGKRMTFFYDPDNLPLEIHE